MGDGKGEGLMPKMRGAVALKPWRAKITVPLSTVPRAPAGEKASPVQANRDAAWSFLGTITAHRSKTQVFKNT